GGATGRIAVGELLRSRGASDEEGHRCRSNRETRSGNSCAHFFLFRKYASKHSASKQSRTCSDGVEAGIDRGGSGSGNVRNISADKGVVQEKSIRHPLVNSLILLKIARNCRAI